MCGFIASTGASIEKGLELLKHRGVRSRVVGPVGHVRLPIVGLGSEYDQPITVGRWIIAFVGELLDFREEYKGMECDIEAVERKWVMNGPRAFLSNDGFWSIAVFDQVNKELHLLCDYLAQKPIYYRKDINAAASEPDAVAVLAPVTIDQLYMSAVQKWGYCPEPWRTPYREINKVLPGQHVVLGRELFKQEITDPLRTIPASPDELKNQIDVAVRRRVQSSDVPVACLLSGGLDSSIVFTLAQRYGDVIPYYVSLEDDFVEALRVSAVAGKTKVQIVPWANKPSWKEAMEIFQEPIDLGSLVPQVLLSRSVEERVCLTGDGADELFGGYGRAERYDSQLSDVWHELVAWHLPRLDRVMMREQIEVRSPFLSRQVAGIALGLDRKHRTGKKILRDLFRKDLPPGIADQGKIPLRTSETGEARTIEMVREFDQ